MSPLPFTTPTSSRPPTIFLHPVLLTTGKSAHSPSDKGHRTRVAQSRHSLICFYYLPPSLVIQSARKHCRGHLTTLISPPEGKGSENEGQSGQHPGGRPAGFALSSDLQRFALLSTLYFCRFQGELLGTFRKPETKAGSSATKLCLGKPPKHHRPLSSPSCPPRRRPRLFPFPSSEAARCPAPPRRTRASPFPIGPP